MRLSDSPQARRIAPRPPARLLLAFAPRRRPWLRDIVEAQLEVVELVVADLGRARPERVALAEPGGYVRLFIDEGQPVSLILRKAISRDCCPDYARRLQYALEGKKPVGDRSAAAGLPEPISEREMEVMKLLRSSLTAPEIAAQLFVAESTVRSHVKSIYSKLGVHRRLDAVRKAEDLGLL